MVFMVICTIFICMVNSKFLYNCMGISLNSLHFPSIALICWKLGLNSYLSLCLRTTGFFCKRTGNYCKWGMLWREWKVNTKFFFNTILLAVTETSWYSSIMRIKDGWDLSKPSTRFRHTAPIMIVTNLGNPGFPLANFASLSSERSTYAFCLLCMSQ